MTRILLAALAVASFASLTAPAEARPTSAKVALVQIDVAAIPAYPFAGPVKATPARRAGASRSAKRSGARHRAVEASKAIPAPPQGQIGSGIVRSAKTGASARVAPRHRAKFQAYVDDLESRGASIHYMGGLRRGRCSLASQHPCGGALDVCQDSRDRVSGRKNCHLPSRAELISIAAAHGLFEGGQWCHGDMGHAQVIPTASSCSRNLYAAVTEFHARVRP